MNSGKTIFAQLMDFLPIYEFHQWVQRYHGHYKMKSFSCWDQFLCMAFAQPEYVGFNLIVLGTITILTIFFAPKGIIGTFHEKFLVELFPIRRQ